MAVRSMPFAHWNPHWGAAAIGLGGAGATVLSVAGHGEAALALLAALGAAGSVLLAAGQLQFTSGRRGLNDRASRVFSALPVPFAVTDKKGIILWRSEVFLNTVGGLGLEQDLSRLGERHPETAASIFRLFAAARKGCPHAETINLPQVAHGEPVVLKVSPFTNPDMDASLLIWAIEKTQVTRAVDVAGGGILAALPLPALSISKDLYVEGMNRSFEKLVGSSPVGQQAWSIFRTRRGNPLTRARLRDMIAKPLGPISVQLVSAGGFTQPANLHLVTPPGGAATDAETQYWIVMPADAGGALEEYFETLLSRAPVGMALVSSRGIIETANEAFRRLLSDPSGDAGSYLELTGKELWSVVSETSVQNVRDKIAGLSEGGLGFSGPVELHAALKGPPNRRVRLVIFPAANGNNFIVSAVETGSAVPIDEQAAQSQKLQAVGELAGGIAHDFNNLLTAIIGFSDLLLRRFRASDPAFKDLMNIKNNAMRAAELVQQILAYSRRQTLRPVIIKVTEVVEQYLATMGRALGEKVKVKVQHGRDLWFVKADEGQLFQVIMNLAVNARDAMTDGGEITIRTANVSERESLGLKDRGLDRGEYVMCEVRDTGSGIRPEHLEKIFDPFFSTKEVGKGTGLGLSTVYGIVKQTGGVILVDSEIGVGTCFRVYLPRYAETEDDLKTLESRAEGPERIVDLTGSGTVLLVEDEDAVRSFASRALATRGYTVLEAASGVEALEIMDRENGQVDLVVSDVVMPEMDGPTLLRHLRERNPDIRIVFMSGYAEEAFRKNLNAEEDFIFLPKPFTLKKLAETVKAAAA
jgi:two-component system cell cycle sensor histidine kinase/response regulator CckA